jgi:hypothetical protein
MKRRFRLRRQRAVVLALSASALAAVPPTAVAATWEDLRSPDARDAAVVVEQRSVGYSDLRSPDARDAAHAAQQQAESAAAARDLRSPDARDAARGITPGSQSAPEVAPVDTRTTVIAVEERGSQTLAIVFSASALLIALLAVGWVAITRRARPRWTAP